MASLSAGPAKPQFLPSLIGLSLVLPLPATDGELPLIGHWGDDSRLERRKETGSSGRARKRDQAWIAVHGQEPGLNASQQTTADQLLVEVRNTALCDQLEHWAQVDGGWKGFNSSGGFGWPITRCSVPTAAPCGWSAGRP